MIESHIRRIILFFIVGVYSVEIASGMRFTSIPAVNIFMHANLVHLALCAYCLWAVLERRPLSNIHMLSVGLFCATVATYLSPYPFEGTSGIIFAITGIRLAAYPLRSNYVRVAIATAICTAIQPTSWCVHGLPLLLGYLYHRFIGRRCAA